MTSQSSRSHSPALVSERRDVDYRGVAEHIRAEGYDRFVGGFDRVVFTNGCFDILHAGHLSTLKLAFNLAGPTGAVVVGLNTDASVARLKGPSRPVVGEHERAELIVSLKYVDYVVTFDEDTPLKLIEALRPDVIVKGGDYDPTEVVGNHMARVEVAPYVEGLSTSEIVRRIREMP